MRHLLQAGWERNIRFLQARISPQGYMGLHLTIGMIAIILTCWCFNEIAESIDEGGTLAFWDARAAELFQGFASAELTRVARFVSALGSVAFLTVASICAAVLFVWRRWYDALVGLALTMIGGSLLNMLLKRLFQRQRPIFENPLVDLPSFAFPSGHTMGATLFYIFLAAIAAHSIRGKQMRVLAVCCAIGMVVMIGATRIYLGAHFFTDVLGAIVAGLAWLAFCWTAVETLRKWRKRQRARSSR